MNTPSLGKANGGLRNIEVVSSARCLNVAFSSFLRSFVSRCVVCSSSNTTKVGKQIIIFHGFFVRRLRILPTAVRKIDSTTYVVIYIMQYIDVMSIQATICSSTIASTDIL